jgi:uncharacterized protein
MQRKSFPITLFFHGSLNDFLPSRKRHQWLTHWSVLPSSLKDTIESIGVPHVEIEKVLVNQQEKSLSYQPEASDAVEVFPFQHALPPNAPKSFVLDVHLGALARLLRMMGIDAVYQNNHHDKDIVSTAARENRAVLTRDIGLLKHKILNWGYWLRSQHPEEQAAEVIRRFSLRSSLRPFSRCISCNGMLKEVEKARVLHLLPPQTKECFDVFYQCNGCGKVYWEGSHYEHMQHKLEKLLSLADQ